MYHRVASPVAGLPSPTINVPPLRFQEQLEGLVRRGHVFLPLRRVVEAANRGEPLPEKAIVVTFDDGFASVFTNAYPVLRRLNIPATVFLNTAYLGSAEPMPFDHWGLAHWRQAPPNSYRAMTWEMCRQLQAEGLVELGAHTQTHQDFRDRPRDFAADLRENVRQLREQLGVSDPTFAFPYGTPRLGFADQELTTEARHAGVSCALNTRHQLVSSGSDPFTWGRIHAFDWDTSTTLAAKLAGWYGWIPAQRQRINRLLGRANPRLDAVAIPAAAPLLPRLPEAAIGGASAVDVSVIVPTYNRAHWLGEALESLSAQQTEGRLTFEVIVVNNRSDDNTAEVVAAHAAHSAVPVRCLHEGRPGDAPTRNRGVLAARGQWLAFFDDDQFAEPRWLLELMQAARQSGALVVGGPVLLDLPEQELQQLGPVCRAALREIRFYDRLQPYRERDLPGTGNGLVHRSVMEAVGAFDVTMSFGGSDSDFFMRARRAGFTPWYAPRAAIRHRISRSRLSPAYFRWDSLSGGAGHAAHFDQQRLSLPGQIFLCGLRLVQAGAVTAPRLAGAWLRGDRGGVLGQKTRLWRAEGYLRATLKRLAPRLFAQQAFFESMNFRSGRTFSCTSEPRVDQVSPGVEEVVL